MNRQSLKTRTDQFLACKNIAIIGISPGAGHEASVANFRKLKKSGYQVFAVNPNRTAFEDQKCYPNVLDIPENIEAALIFTHPDVTLKAVKSCCEKGIKNIWIHQGLGQGSRSEEATQYLKLKEDVNLIDGACPMMFIKKADWFHYGAKKVLGWMDKLPA